jgi:hypothetical protein
MGISLGLFDVFTYIVPGSLYLALIVFVAEKFSWIEIGQLKNVPSLMGIEFRYLPASGDSCEVAGPVNADLPIFGADVLSFRSRKDRGLCGGFGCRGDRLGHRAGMSRLPGQPQMRRHSAIAAGRHRPCNRWKSLAARILLALAE